MENKSKFGLSAAVMGALVYLAGGFSALALIVLLIAITLYEENEFVKVCVKRAAVIFIAYTAVDYVLIAVSRLFSTFFGYSNFLYKLFDIIDSCVYIAYIVIVILMAVKALINPKVEESILDAKAIDKVTDVVSNVASNVSSKMAAPKKACPKCGKEVPADNMFCPSCGEKIEEKAE